MAEPLIAPFTLCETIQLRGPGSVWVEVLTEPTLPADFVADLQGDCEAMLGRPLPVLNLAAMHVNDLRQRLGGVRNGAVLTGLDDWSDAHWRTLDVNRGALENRGPIVLLLSRAAAGRLADAAPNVRSLVGGSTFQPAPDEMGLSPEESNSRLAEFRQHYGWDDAEMIAKRYEGIALDAHMAEWLVLLGRGDLI